MFAWAGFVLLGTALVLTPAPTGAQGGPTPPAFATLAAEAAALFPQLEGDVVDVQGPTLTLSFGRASGARPGLVLEVFREGRELRHPRTGQVLGRAEQPLGRAMIQEVLETHALAVLEGTPVPVAAGDRVRTPGGKVRLTLLVLAEPGLRAAQVEALSGELYEAFTRGGRFQVLMGDPVALWLAQEKIGGADLLRGRGVREVAERFRAEHLLVVHVTLVQRKPFMEVRLFSGGRPEPVWATAMAVPSSVKPAPPGRFSGGGGRETQAPERKPRSLLARLLGWGEDPTTYSSAESAIALRELARFPFVAVSMDVAVAPVDRLPRVVVTEGERIWVYRLEHRRLEPEWTYWARAVGRVISVQFADVDGDGVLDVVANRFDSRTGMSSLIVGLRGGKPVALVDQVDAILYAVDERGTGVRQTLWAQRYREESFFTRGQADQMVLRDGRLVRERAAVVPDQFRATGAVFTNVTGQGQRALAYIDEQGRLRVALGTEELWRSSSTVGGGGAKIEVVRYVERGGRSYFYRMEPAPLAVDLDGDGIEEVVVPQNQGEHGLLAVVFRGPAGLRLQQVNTGFEGIIVGLGAVPGEGHDPPALVAGVVRYRNILRTGGETQIIMTAPE